MHAAGSGTRRNRSARRSGNPNRSSSAGRGNGGRAAPTRIRARASRSGGGASRRSAVLDGDLSRLRAGGRVIHGASYEQRAPNLGNVIVVVDLDDLAGL